MKLEEAIQIANNLAPCPFCGSPLHFNAERFREKGVVPNPSARCHTEGCFGTSLPVVSLDIPEQVAAWNRRAPLAAPEPSNRTRDGVEVKVGQVWKDLDVRMNNRHGKVVAVLDGKAHLKVCSPNGREFGSGITKISISRMHRGSTGWAFVHDVEREPEQSREGKEATVARNTSSPLFRDRVPESAAQHLAAVLAWLTECQLATLESLEMVKRTPKSELARQQQICDQAVAHCKDLGVSPRGLRGDSCPRLAERLQD